jgi:hypothetical protein
MRHARIRRPSRRSEEACARWQEHLLAQQSSGLRPSAWCRQPGFGSQATEPLEGQTGQRHDGGDAWHGTAGTHRGTNHKSSVANLRDTAVGRLRFPGPHQER